MVWDVSGGRLGRRVTGMPVLELVAKGHKSGQERSILITYVDAATGPAIAGTNAGAETDPAWAQNLRADPNARMRRAGQWHNVRARWLSGAEYDAVWARFVAANHGYAEYEAMLDRRIPIVALDPVG